MTTKVTESMPHPSRISRRTMLASVGALGLGALVTACGSADDDGGDTSARSSESAKSGGFSFTDDRGTKVSLPARPTRLVAYVGAAAALWDYGVRDQLVGVYGPAKLKDGRPDPQVGAVDVSKVEVIGNVYGEFNVEKYAGLRPELLIDNMFVRGELFYVPTESKDKIFKLAPQIGVQAGDVPVQTPIRRYAELAAALGADLGAPQVAQAKARFEAAARALSAAAEANPVRVLAASASPDLFYASNPGKNADLRYFKELGVDVILPRKLNSDGYFEELSWENADKYQADLIILDSRTQALRPTDLGGKPTWAELPAVKAGQVIGWNPEPRLSYAGFAPILETLAQSITKARRL